MRPLKDRLRVLGIEGSIWTKQTIESLAPLEGFAIEALFLTSTRLFDQDLAPVATMPNIRLFWTAINAPRAQFFALRKAKPKLECSWCDPASWGGFKDPRPPRKMPQSLLWPTVRRASGRPRSGRPSLRGLARPGFARVKLVFRDNAIPPVLLCLVEADVCRINQSLNLLAGVPR